MEGRCRSGGSTRAPVMGVAQFRNSFLRGGDENKDKRMVPPQIKDEKKKKMKKKPGMQRAYRRVAVIVTESANVDQSSRE